MHLKRSLERILYIEDEQDIRDIARLALEAIGGFNVMICASGAEGLSNAPLFVPDLVLLDVMMPEMDGMATFAALRNIDILAETPIVFLTATYQVDEIKRFQALGAAGIIQKPFDPMTLSKTISVIWDRAIDP